MCCVWGGCRNLPTDLAKELWHFHLLSPGREEYLTQAFVACHSDHICRTHLAAFRGTGFVYKVRRSVGYLWQLGPTSPPQRAVPMHWTALLICCWMGREMLASRTLLENAWDILWPKATRVSPKFALCLTWVHGLAPPTPKYHRSHASALYVPRPRSELNTRNIFYDVMKSALNHAPKCRKRARVISAPSCEACPEGNHPEALLSHFKKKTNRCPYPEVALPQCMFATPKPCPLTAECLFCLKRCFQSRHFYEAKSSNEATNSPFKTW